MDKDKMSLQDEQVQEAKRPSRELLLERFKERYPESAYDDDDAIYDQVMSDYDEADKELERYKDNEAKLTGLFQSDPRSSAYLESWANGGHPIVELVRLFGSDMVEALDDPEIVDQLAEANQEYLDKVAESTKLGDEYEENLTQSLESIEAYQNEKGYDDATMESLLNYIGDIASGFIQGKITPELLDMAYKATTREEDIATAAHEAEVRGRNAKIMDKMKDERATDGIPKNLSGSNATPERDPLEGRDLGVVGRGSSNYWEEALKEAKLRVVPFNW